MNDLVQVAPKQQNNAGEWFGLRYGNRGTHTSRTMMLAELTELLKFTGESTGLNSYRAAIVDDNLLGKRTVATRKLTAQRLAELYGLDPAVPIFRVLRRLWDTDRPGRPLLAFAVAFARDPLLRLTVDAVLTSPRGRAVTTAAIDAAIEERIGPRLNPSVRNKVARNASSSWTQSGHLQGRAIKLRAKPTATPGSASLILLLGYVTGLRGRALLSSSWTRLLDTAHAELTQLIQAAHRQGLLNFREVGDVFDVQFPSLLRPHEETLCHV